MALTHAERDLATPRTAVRSGEAVHPVGALQQSAGNRAVSSMLSGGPAVQRHQRPTSNTEVGAPEQEVNPAGGSGTGTTGTGTGTGTTGTAGLSGAPRKKAIEDTLRASNTGVWALDIVKKWSIPVDYDFGGTGSYHQGGNIYINKDLGVGAAAITMMHEAQHADTFKSGKGADRETLTRAEYVRLSIADEAEAVVRQIEGMAVTQRLGVDMTGNAISDGLKQRYLTAFYAKRDELNAANPTMTTAAVNALCRTHCRDTEVTSWFHDGTFVTSTDNNSYAVFYGLQWDEVHTPPAAGP